MENGQMGWSLRRQNDKMDASSFPLSIFPFQLISFLVFPFKLIQSKFGRYSYKGTGWKRKRKSGKRKVNSSESDSK